MGADMLDAMRTAAVIVVSAVAAVVALRRWLPGVLDQVNREHVGRWE